MSTLKSTALLLILSCLALFHVAFAQPSTALIDNEAGLPFIQNFGPKDYRNAHAQNWAVLQDERGIMYIGNGLGVLEYDGVDWRLIPVTNRTPARKLAMGLNGRIYVGARREIGYLAADSLSQLQYVSLLAHIPEEYHNFSNTFQLEVTPEGIYFASRNLLFRWQPEKTERFENLEKKSATEARLLNTHESGTMEIWELPRLHRIFRLKNTLYAIDREIGLLAMTKVAGADTLLAVPGGEQVAGQFTHIVLPYSSTDTQSLSPEQTASLERVIIGNRSRGLFSFDGENFRPFSNKYAAESSAFLNDARPRDGLMFSDGSFIVPTLRKGAVLIDWQGRLKQVINKTAGLRDETVRSIYRDREGALWLALNNGLARIEIPGPFTAYNQIIGLNGSVNSIIKTDNALFTSGSKGVHSAAFSGGTGDYPQFSGLPGTLTSAAALLSLDDRVLVAMSSNLYQITKNQLVMVENLRARSLYQSRYYRNLVFVGLHDGLAVLKKNGDQWQLVNRIADFKIYVHSIVEESPGVLWLGLFYDGFSRITIPALQDTLSGEPWADTEATEIAATIEYFDKSHGLPRGTGRVFYIDQRPVFATNKGLRRFDPLKIMFTPDSTFGIPFADTTRLISRMVEGNEGVVWTKSTSKEGRRETWFATPASKSGEAESTTIRARYTPNNIPFSRIADWGSVYALYPDPEQSGILWIGGPDGMLRYDRSVQKDYAVDFPALVRRVVTLKQDSVIFGGAVSENTVNSDISTLAYAFNGLRFQYAAPSHDDPSQNRYQVYLEGFDEGWSAWNAETQKDYTNLPEGDYRFRVRAKNIYQHESSEGIYQFTILPPWHRSWWAYMLFSILFIAFFALSLYGYNKRRTRQLRAQTRALEATVKERTTEIVAKNAQLAEQAEQLQELNTMKSRFFANISHEFRTPLTLIMGPVEQAIDRINDPDLKNKMSGVQRNAQRLLRLINELLDLAKLEAGKLTLQASQGNIVTFCKGMVATFAAAAEIRKIDLQLNISPSTIDEQTFPPIYFDHDKMEKVFVNILSNALKFTPDKGRIILELGIPEGAGRISELKDKNTPKIQLPDPVTKNSEFPVPNSEFSKQCVQIRISDSGAGIPAEDLPHIFDRFYQARDESGSTNQLGSGIGMALAKELVELHQGSISVESEIGKGTTVTIQLPFGNSRLSNSEFRIPNSELKDKEGPKIQLSDPITENIGIDNSEFRPAPSGIPNSEFENSEIVLIVEDNPDMRTYIRESLIQKPRAIYDIREAANGREGFEQATAIMPDLIISDVMMPEMDGYQLCEKLKTDERTSHVPVILLTARAGEESKIAGLETGADAYLTKPFNSRELLVRVKNLIAQRRKLRQQFSNEVHLKPRDIAITSADEQFLQKAIDIVEANIGNENFSIEDFAAEIGLSRSQLHRKIQALTDQSPSVFIRSLRLKRAVDLIEQKAATINEIAYQTGFSSPAYFRKCFREQFGVSPKEYQRRS